MCQPGEWLRHVRLHANRASTACWYGDVLVRRCVDAHGEDAHAGVGGAEPLMLMMLMLTWLVFSKW